MLGLCKCGGGGICAEQQRSSLYFGVEFIWLCYPLYCYKQLHLAMLCVYVNPSSVFTVFVTKEN